ncbi:GNAT family N-acetyltransferase [Microvirga flavescens]|uniref:GNAT family N-acetyltransferase n=1 Tax=Microvirga flavescens TaxID=2249811 RepID=UPI000DD99DAF|nr:GNAT family protein [Microvirga flavescens]
MLKIEPVTLANDRLILKPMTLADVPALAEAVQDGSLWEKKTTITPPPGGMEAFVMKALDLQTAGSALPFVIVAREADKVVGSTRYMNIDAVNHRVEIGTTWVSKSWQRSFVNTNAKYLLLRHAFEVLGCNVVELRTHRLNDQSRAAIERLGAKLDGILRSHMIMPDGHIRDTAVYSILKEEWPEVKAGLEARLAAYAAAAR